MKIKITFTGMLLAILFCSNVQAQTVTVTSSNDSGPGSFRQAVLDADAGEQIVFDASLNGQTITLASPIVIDKELIITGNGATNTTISGNNATRILSIADATVVIIRNITLTNGSSATVGGAILCTDTAMTINNCVISNSKAHGAVAGQGGGGIFFSDTSQLNTLTINDSTITGNEADGVLGSGGGLYVINANSTLNVCTISNNTAAANGGGIYNTEGTMTVNSITITGNTAEGDAEGMGGGGIFNAENGILTVPSTSIGNVISNNTANGSSGAGGGILCVEGAQYVLGNATLEGNTATRFGGGIADISGGDNILGNVNVLNNQASGSQGCGGGIYINDGTRLIMASGSLRNNTASLQGGGSWSGNGTMSFNSVTISENVAEGDSIGDGGGGLYHSSGELGLHNSSVLDNLATGTNSSGGGILFLSGTGSFASNVADDLVPVTGNSANRSGGGIEIVDGIFTINSCDLSDNDVNGVAGTANPGNGGGLHIGNGAELNMNGCTISNNTAANQGGGLWHDNNSIAIVAFTTIADNEAANGAGTYTNGGVLVLSNSTVSGNSTNSATGNGGGVYVNGGAVALMVVTISGNSAAGGGGVFVNNGVLSSNAVTITNNTAAGNGGGIFSSSATPSMIKNTIVEGNTAMTGKDIYNDEIAITSNGYNLIGIIDESDIIAAETDITGTLANPQDASLLPLADNGGPTLTHAFDCPSPAADKGNPAETFGDQTGQLVFNTIRDIGAYEAQEICTLSNGEFTVAKSMVYPNPSVNGKFTLELASAGTATISVYEMATGKLVKQMETDSINTEISLNVTPGIYIMQVVSENASEMHKLVVGK